RGPLISLILTIIAIFIISVFNNNKTTYFRKRLTFILIGLLILFILMLSIGLMKKPELIDRLLTIGDMNSLSRINMYLTSLELIKENPLGYGIGSFNSIFKGVYEYPHNLILEIFFELGLIGIG